LNEVVSVVPNFIWAVVLCSDGVSTLGLGLETTFFQSRSRRILISVSSS